MTNSSAAAACIAMLLSVTLTGCGEKNAGKKGAAAPPVLKGISTAAVALGVLPREVEAAGTVRARSSALLAARISGTVTSVQVREGDRVGAGKLVAVIESGETAAAAAGAAAGVEEARRGVGEAAARERLAETSFARFERLLAEGAITRQEFDAKKAEREMAGEGLARAKARLLQAEEQRRGAATVAGYSRVVSPVAGTVTSRTVEPGMTVFPGTPLATVEEQGHYRLEAALPESAVGRVRAGGKVRVVLDGRDSRDGRVAEIMPAADPQTRTVTVKIDLPGDGLRSGMYGKALFAVGLEKGITVPARSVVTRGALTSVWVVDRENRVRMRLVKPGRATADGVEILAGLSDGEKIVLSGTERIVEGALLQ